MAASIQPLLEAQPNLGLPFAPEIRNEIYKHALSDPAQREGGGPDTSPLQLLLVSRQTNIEAYAMYYRINKLHFPNLTLLARFLWNIGDARRAHITNLSFTYNLHDATPRGMGQLLKACSSWRHITVDVRTCCSREPDRYLARVLSQLSTRNWAAVGKRLQKEAGNTVAAQTRAELGGFEAADDEAEG